MPNLLYERVVADVLDQPIPSPAGKGGKRQLIVKVED